LLFLFSQSRVIIIVLISERGGTGIGTGTLRFGVRTDSIHVQHVHGPKFGRRRSSAECSVRLSNMWLFGQSSAELRQTFGVICAFAFSAFCARRWR